MRGWSGIVAAALVAVALTTYGAHAACFNPLVGDERPAAPITDGAAVFLFHGGTGEARRSANPGDVLAVVRPRMSGRSEAVGAVRVVAPAGALCFRGEVVEGDLQAHDVAHAGPAACLVIPTDAPCQREEGR